jgi:hypothetical protein
MTIKISQLPSTSTLADANVFPLVANVSGTLTSQQATLAILKSYVLAGNAATATQLASSRSINGVPFNGTQDITINVALLTATTSVLGGVKVDGTTVTINGSGVISAAPLEATTVHAFATDGNNDLIYTKTTGQTFNYTTDGQNSPYSMVDIGTDLYNYSIDANGNLLATFSS